MSSYTSISSDKLSRLIGTANAPVMIDVRTDEDFASDPRLVPGSHRRPHQATCDWAGKFAGRSAIVICQSGKKLSEGAAAWLRHSGVLAETLDGGFDAWKAAKLPLVPASKLPIADAQGRTVWVTRSRPKIDRIACPWLIRRFMIDEFGLSTPPLLRLAEMVRAADTSRLDLSPEAPGLLAASLGLSRMYDDDLEQLEGGMLIYDVFYRWCRDATGETHNWPTTKPTQKAAR